MIECMYSHMLAHVLPCVFVQERVGATFTCKVLNLLAVS
jgi:hypothetical protein